MELSEFSDPLLDVFRDPRLDARDPKLLPEDTDNVLAERLQRKYKHTGVTKLNQHKTEQREGSLSETAL